MSYFFSCLVCICKTWLLAYDTNSEMLRDYFGKYGNISDCNVPTDAKTRLSKGFGFVIYRESRILDEVMKLRPHKLDGRVLEPRRAIDWFD